MNIKKNSPLKQEEHHAVEKEEAEGDAYSSLRKWVTISKNIRKRETDEIII